MRDRDDCEDKIGRRWSETGLGTTGAAGEKEESSNGEGTIADSVQQSEEEEEGKTEAELSEMAREIFDEKDEHAEEVEEQDAHDTTDEGSMHADNDEEVAQTEEVKATFETVTRD